MIAGYNLHWFELLERLLQAALVGLPAYTGQGALDLPVEYRLAFRELGLSIGLRAVERLQRLVEVHPGIFADRAQLLSHLAAFSRYTPLAGRIEQFWPERRHQEAESWLAHREINMVMLATSLAPDGYLTL